jgi:hypothetical protein
LDESSFISSKATMRDLRILDKSRYTFRLNFSPFT